MKPDGLGFLPRGVVRSIAIKDPIILLKTLISYRKTVE